MKKIFILLFLLNTCFSFAQGIKIISRDVSAFPAIKVEYFLFGADNKPVAFDREKVAVNYNGSFIVPRILECSENIHANSSVTLLFDLSLNTPEAFSQGMSIAAKVVENLDYSSAELALMSFGDIPILNSYFSTDKASLLIELSKFKQARFSSLNSALASSPLNAISLASGGQKAKSIIIITDNVEDIDSKILADAQSAQIKIIVISINKKANPELASLAKGSAGAVLDEIEIAEDPSAVANSALSLAQGLKPCLISWNGRTECGDFYETTISSEKNSNIKDTFSFSLPAAFKPGLETDPPYLGFSSVMPGLSKSMDIRIYARNADVKIYKTYLDKPSGIFAISNGSVNSETLVKKDQFITLTIKYAPVDSAIVFTKLIIESEACSGNEVNITGGFPNKEPKERTLKILKPDCNDVLIAGDKFKIEWTGLLPADVIQLEYSINNGISWDTLARNITGLSYDWLVPNIKTDQLLIRAVQMWPNNIGKTINLKHFDAVNSAFFSRDGSKVLTTSFDGTAVIWNSSTGIRQFALKEHTKPVLFGRFSPDDLLAATASADSTVIIWDVPTGKLKYRLSGHTDMVRSVDFSSDGKYLATAGKDKNVMIWNPKDGSLIKSFKADANSLYFAAFSPDGAYLATTGNSGFVRIYKTSDWSLYKQLDNKLGSPTAINLHVAYSNDGKNIAVTNSLNKKTTVWDIEKEDTLYTVSHNPDSSKNSQINTSYFYFNRKGEEILVTSAVDNARMWNSKTGAYISPSFQEHSNAVQTTNFSFDGIMVVTSSWDSTAKVWKLDQYALQIDTNDCIAKIAEPQLEARDIIFSDTPVGLVSDTLVSPFLLNKSGGSFELNQVKIEGGASADFSIIQNPAPSLLDTLNKNYIEIAFKPSSPGLREADIVINYLGGSVKYKIKGFGIQPALRVANAVDFGKVEIGDFKDINIVKAFENISGKLVTIDSIKLETSFSSEFETLYVSPSANLQQGGTIDIDMRFKPLDLGVKQGVLTVYHSAEVSPARLPVIGEGVIAVKDTLDVMIPEIHGKPGDIVKIPLIVKNISAHGIASDIKALRFYIRFNKSLLYPLSSFESEKIEFNDRIIEYKAALPAPDQGFIKLNKGDIIKELEFAVALGNDSSTVLSLENIYPEGEGKIYLFPENGKFILEGICREAGPRLFEDYGIFDLKQNSPNPFSTSTQIQFELPEEGFVKFYVLDIMGTQKIIINENMRKGFYSFFLNAGDFNSGIYTYILEINGRSSSRTFNVIK